MGNGRDESLVAAIAMDASVSKTTNPCVSTRIPLTSFSSHKQSDPYSPQCSPVSAPVERTMNRMVQHTSIAISASYRKAGWTAIASGVIGIAAFGLLMTAVTTRASWIPSDKVWMLFNAHDLGVALQFLLLLFAIFGLRTLADQTPPGLGKAAFATGVWAVIFAVSSYFSGSVGRLCRTAFTCFHKGYWEHGSSR